MWENDHLWIWMGFPLSVLCSGTPLNWISNIYWLKPLKPVFCDLTSKFPVILKLKCQTVARQRWHIDFEKYNYYGVARQAKRRIPVSHKYPPGDWTWVPYDGKQTGGPLDQWNYVWMQWDYRLSTRLPPAADNVSCEARRRTCNKRETGTEELCEIKWNYHIVGTVTAGYFYDTFAYEICFYGIYFYGIYIYGIYRASKFISINCTVVRNTWNCKYP